MADYTAVLDPPTGMQAVILAANSRTLANAPDFVAALTGNIPPLEPATTILDDPAPLVVLYRAEQARDAGSNYVTVLLSYIPLLEPHVVALDVPCLLAYAPRVNVGIVWPNKN